MLLSVGQGKELIKPRPEMQNSGRVLTYQVQGPMLDSQHYKSLRKLKTQQKPKSEEERREEEEEEEKKKMITTKKNPRLKFHS